jgi:hypothetical protein
MNISICSEHIVIQMSSLPPSFATSAQAYITSVQNDLSL